MQAYIIISRSSSRLQIALKSPQYTALSVRMAERKFFDKMQQNHQTLKFVGYYEKNLRI